MPGEPSAGACKCLVAGCEYFRYWAIAPVSSVSSPRPRFHGIPRSMKVRNRCAGERTLLRNYAASFYLHFCALGWSVMATASGKEATPSTVSTTVFVVVSITEAELL